MASFKKQKKEILITWKEISQYIKHDIRTCQRWERYHNLPVHRYSRSPKSRVYSFKYEIDKWLGNKRININKPFKDIFLINSKKYKLHISVLLLLFSIIIASYLSFSQQLRQPFDFQIEDTKIIILDAKNNELCKIETGNKALAPKESFISIIPMVDEYRVKDHKPFIVFEDIDGNRSKEIILIIKSNDQSTEHTVHCFSKKGREIWKFPVNKKMIFGEKEYSANYKILGFEICGFNEDRNSEIIIASNHAFSFLGQIIILDSQGNQLTEYWNSGHLKDFNVFDLDQDGIKEIIVAGIDAERECTNLTVLNFPFFDGSSPQNKKYFKCKDFNLFPGKYQIIFPRNEIDNLNNRNNSLLGFEIYEKDKQIFIKYTCSVYYYLNSQMELIDIGFSPRFSADLNKYQREGKINKSLNQIREELNIRGLQYFDGEKFQNIPTLANIQNTERLQNN